MRPFTAVAVLLAALCVSACATSRLASRGLQDAVGTEEAVIEAGAPRRIALLIGIDDYDSVAVPDLAFAGADAAGLAEALGSDDIGGFDEITVVSAGDEATRAGLRAVFSDVLTTLQPGDVFVLYFSGHGLSSSPDALGRPSRRYLLPSDADPADLDGTAWPLDEVVHAFARSAARRKLAIIDACWSAGGKGQWTEEPRPPSIEDDAGSTLEASLGGAGEAYLFATSRGAPAFEDRALGHGVYSYYLLEAMGLARSRADVDGDLLLSAWEAHDYARRRVMTRTGGGQTPEASIRVVGDGDVILAGDPGQRRISDLSLVSFYGGAARFRGATLLVDGRARGSLPGTVPVEPGERFIELKSSDGESLVAGRTEIGRRQRLSVQELRHRLHAPSGLQWVHAGVVARPTAGLGAYRGHGAVSFSLGGAWRASKAARGLTIGAQLGLSVSPPDGVRVIYAPRGVVRPSLLVGWSGAGHRVSPRLLWRVGVGGLFGATTEPRWSISTGPQVGLRFALTPVVGLSAVTTASLVVPLVDHPDSRVPGLEVGLGGGFDLAF